MSTTQSTTSLLDEARAKVMELPEKDRVQLAYELLDSVDDDETDLENDAEFMAEIVRRSDEVREGKVVPLTLEEHLQNVRHSLEQPRP